MSVRRPGALSAGPDAKRARGGEPTEQLTSPRLRASLGPSTADGGGTLASAKAVAVAAAAVHGGATSGVAGSSSGLAPRCAGTKLAEVRAAFDMTPAQFAEQLRSALAEKADKAAKQLEPVTAKALNKWEAGLARVPMRVSQLAERLHSQLLRELEAQAAGAEALQHIAQVYPRQESMIGPDFQAVVPKHVTGGSMPVKPSRDDEIMWCPRTAESQGVVVDEYLSKVRSTLDGAEDIDIAYDEEVALQILCTLKYNVSLAISALEWVVAWRRGDGAQLAELQSVDTEGGRLAAVNAMLWLHHLRRASRERSHGVGVFEALQAGLLRHGKDLASVRKTHLAEKSVFEVIDLYYRAPGKYTDCVSFVEEDRLIGAKEELG